ncbi:trimethylamine methyltransferase family protein, partial [Deltaproteobacteria bacterium OttesenSCG-928-K17]|nr:trimethylamine methyltransferase family protein [Deltaproteobacteria bacterium OttesenSCG-928-K17]
MFPLYDVLNAQEIKDVHEASLQVLEETGVYLSHPKAQEVLSSMGAKVSDDKTKVFFPRDLVEKMLAKMPASFICGSRDGLPEHELEMKQGNTYMRQVGGPISLFDMRTSKTTTMTLEDNINAARLIDGLPNINVASCMTPQDINPKTYDIAVVKALFENSRKHFWALTTDSSHLKYELEMALAVAGSPEQLRKKPPFSGIFCVIDPLRYPDDELERLMLYGQHNIPIRVPITSLIGANAPYTLAGALTQINSEFLSAAVITQAMCPGIGVWYYTLLQILDMKTGRSVANGPELMIAYAAAAQMARHYNVPSTFSTGTLTDTQSHQ